MGQWLALALTIALEVALVAGVLALRPSHFPTSRGQVLAVCAAASLVTHPIVWHLNSVVLADLPFAEHLDYAMAAGVRSGLKSTPLMDSLEQLLQANFSAAEPADIHAILYSDGTIGGARAIARFRRKEIARRMEGKGRDQRAAVAAEMHRGAGRVFESGAGRRGARLRRRREAVRVLKVSSVVITIVGGRLILHQSKPAAFLDAAGKYR